MTVEHFWHKLPGYFTFPEFYSFLAAELATHRPLTVHRDRDRVVEVGVHSGQSVAYLGVELLNRRCECGHPVRTRIDCVDHFHGGTEAVHKNLEPIAEVLGEIIASDSAEAAKRYSDGSLSAVFIDADHGEESVGRDIDAWKPKVRPGGILAGHDFAERFPGVVKAVIDRFDRFGVMRCSLWPMTEEAIRGHALREYFPVWWVRVP